MDEGLIDICLFFFSQGVEFGSKIEEEIGKDCSVSDIEERIIGEFQSIIEKLNELQTG